MAQETQFDVRLFQQARVHTETFAINAVDENDARKQAEKIAADKGLTEGYDFEIQPTAAGQAPAGESMAISDMPEEDRHLGEV